MLKPSLDIFPDYLKLPHISHSASLFVCTRCVTLACCCCCSHVCELCDVDQVQMKADIDRLGRTVARTDRKPGPQGPATAETGPQGRASSHTVALRCCVRSAANLMEVDSTLHCGGAHCGAVHCDCGGAHCCCCSLCRCSLCSLLSRWHTTPSGPDLPFKSPDGSQSVTQ